MNRDLIWIERERFVGWGCSACAWAWAFDPSSVPGSRSTVESMHNLELQRNEAFQLHVCADHPKR
jgi:hypothetical protein